MISLTTAALLVLTSAATEADCLAVDERGASYPICFDPGRGLELGVGASRRGGEATVGYSPNLRLAILGHSDRPSGSKPASLWFFEHRWFDTRAQLEPSLQSLDLLVYEGVFRRHVTEGFILIPTSNPTLLPFPFDVGLQLRLGRYERRVFEGRGYVWDVARVALLIDPVRSADRRAHLAFGPAIDWTLRNDGERVVHELSPFTGGVLDLGWESRDGGWDLGIRGSAGWVTVPGVTSFTRAEGRAHLGRLLFALNDQPVWLEASGEGTLRGAGVYRATEWTLGAALVMRAFQ